MRIIAIDALPNGGHENQFSISDVEVPARWAIIPDDMEIPDTFPFVNIEVESGVVTSMTAGVVPPPEPDPPVPPEEDVWAEIADAIRNGVNAVD